jgi:hypothetical protein
MTIDPLSFGLANVNLVLRVVDGVQKLVDKANESNPDLGKLYDSVKKLISNRTYLSPSTPFEGTGLEDEYEDKEAVEESPAVQAIQRLYEHPIREGVVNVLHDEPGSGKSMAGISVLRDFYSLPGDNTELQGLMVSTKRSTGLYVEILAGLLGASSVEGWLHVLLLALDEPRNRLPFLLILDDFDLDIGGNNLQFIEYLYKSLNPPRGRKKNIMVVVMTQNPKAANSLCKLNGGRRVRPIDGFYDARENDFVEKILTGVFKIRKPEHILTHPTWKGSVWTKDLLKEVLQYHLSESEFSSFGNFDFVKEGMAPFLVIQEARSILRLPTAGKPTSPRKRKSGDSNFPSSNVE